MSSARRWTLLALLAVAPAALAVPFDYDPARSAALRACDRHAWSGEAREAEACYAGLLRGGSILERAEAAWALGALNDANQYFREAIRQAPDDPQLKTRWGRLFIATYQEADAVDLFREALQADPDYALATLGIAAALAEQVGSGAQQQVDEALDADPDLFEGYLLSAEFALQRDQLDAAAAFLDAAEPLAERYEWPRLELYALHAALALLHNDDPQPWIDRAAAENPGWGGVHEKLGEFYLITYRYREAIDAFRAAVETEPQRWSAHSELGINLFRNNQIGEGQHHLEVAYSGDPYNPATVNSLRLLDDFSEFDLLHGEVELVSEDDRPGYRVPVLWRLHESERDMLEPYVRDVTADAIRTLAERYRFVPAEPIVVELFPNHDDFTVRTVSMPGIGLLGVTFGYLFAMDSPTAGRPGDFHWASVLWHEMTHVITLTATGHSIPRWFGEGLSMFEEWQTGPSPGVKVPDYFLLALAEQRLLPIAELDNGFVYPTYENQVMVSYVQAGLICQYISDEWGFDKLVDVLYRFPEGDSVEQAISSVLGYPSDIIDDLFTTWLDTRYGRVIAGIDDWNTMRQAMRDAYQAEAWEEVVKATDLAIEIYPGYVEQDSPYLFKALALDRLERSDEALETLQLYYAEGGHNAQGLSKLADLLLERQRIAEAADVLHALNLIAPQNADVHERLAAAALELGDGATALVEYDVLLALKPHDRASVLLGKARALELLGDYAGMRRQLLMALEIAPHFREAQQLLLSIPKDPT